MFPFWLLSFALAVSLLCSYGYLKFARKHGPYATPNFRSLHSKVVPRGGGLALAAATVAACVAAYGAGLLQWCQLLVYGVGGVVVTLMGAADDRLDLKARYRMPFQCLSAAWVCYSFGGLAPLDMGFGFVDWGLAGHVALIVALVWFYNLYNFIDGIDGMASTATIFICTTMGVVLWMRGQPALAGVLGILGFASAGFLVFNLPPAKMFLGDAGSSLIGYILSAVVVESLWSGPANLWSWLIVGCCYFADTTLTMLVRLLKVPGWYRPHRSHAYQNLARVWNSHRRVLLLVMAINFLWLLPLLVVSLHFASWAIGLTVLAYIPIAIICLKYGPLYANK